MVPWTCTACGEQFDEAVSFCSACGSDEIARTDVPDAVVDSHPQSGGEQSDGHEQTAESAAERRAVPGQNPPGVPPDEPSTASRETAAKEGETAPSQANSPAGRSTDKRILQGGIGATVIGALLPWISISVFGTSVTKRGIDGDGTFTAAAAIIVGALYLAHWTRRAKLGSVVLGALVALLALVYINDPAWGVDAADAETIRSMANIGVGLYLTAVGGAAIAYGSYTELGSG